jgi:hypothetical protein
VSDTFMQKVVAGKVAPVAISEFVAAWHDGGGFNMSLHSYLGMTWEEYAAWAKNPRTLATIVAKHRRARPVKTVNGRFLGTFVNGSPARAKKAAKTMGRSHPKAAARPSAKAGRGSHAKAAKKR